VPWPIRVRVAVPALLAALQDSEYEPRKCAADALGELGAATPDVRQALREALKDRSSAVREAAAGALGRLCRGDEAAEEVSALVQFLGAVLEGGDDRSRERAIDTLDHLGGAAREVLPGLMAALQDRGKYLRQAAARVLGNAGVPDAQAVAGLTEALQDRQFEVRLAAAGSLLRIRGDHPEARALLLAALRHPESLAGRRHRGLGASLVRTAALWALERIGPGAGWAVAALGQLVEAEQVMDFPLAACLGEMGPAARPLVPSLRRRLADANRPARVAAAFALARLGEPAEILVPVLIEAVQAAAGKTFLGWFSGSERVRAAEVLGRLGLAAKAAEPALTEALGSPFRELRKAARDALVAIRGRAEGR
jgi:HEAT repeat protein